MLGIKWSDAEYIGCSNRPRGEPSANDVTNASANSSCSATIWLERRWVVVCLDLETHRMIIVEGHNAGVINKDRKAPVGHAIVHELVRS